MVKTLVVGEGACCQGDGEVIPLVTRMADLMGKEYYSQGVEENLQLRMKNILC